MSDPAKPTEPDTSSDEFEKFAELAKKLVKVPKREVDELREQERGEG
jgi:hypothetical protein